MTKAPAFQLYASDIYMDTVEWTIDEVGIYNRLLHCQWVNGSIPSDITRLARIAGCGTKRFQIGWGIIQFKFVPVGNGRLQNKRLEQTREEQDNYRKSQSEAGKRGAKKRWDKDGDPNGDPIGDPNDQTIALQSSSSNKEKYIKRNASEKTLLTDGVKEVLEFFNEQRKTVTGKNDLRPVTDDVNIIARLKQGGSVYECCRIIATKAKDQNFIDNPKWFHPETLFRKKHWNKYLDEAELLK